MLERIKKSAFTAPLLVIFTGVLSVFVQVLLKKAAFDSLTALCLSYSAAELLVFVLPGVIYVKMRRKGYASDLKLISFGFSGVSLVLLLFIVMALGAVLINIVRVGADVGGELAYDAALLFHGDYFSDADTVFLVGLTLGVVPAFCEEFFFRGVMLSEYRRYGMLPSVLITALYFAILHFDIKKFPYYFLAGLVLGFAAYTVRSVLASAVLHALYNLFSLFALPFVLNFISAEAGVIVFYLTGVAFLLAVMLALGEGERIFAGYSTSGLPSDAPVKRRENFFSPVLEVLSPTFLLCILLFVLTVFRVIRLPGSITAPDAGL